MHDDGAPPRHPEDSSEIGAFLRRRPDRIWGGPGSGAACAACGERIDPEDAELELEFSGADAPFEPVRVHTRCFHGLHAEPTRADGLNQARDRGTLLASGRPTSGEPGSE
jgi:hypothetical protein